MARASVPVLVKDADGFYVFANQAAERLLGYEASQICGLHIDDLCNDDSAWLSPSSRASSLKESGMAA